MAHFNFVISQNAKWGHTGFYIDCHQMTVPENILLQKHCRVHTIRINVHWPVVEDNHIVILINISQMTRRVQRCR